MKKLFLLIAATSAMSVNAQIFKGKDGATSVSFFSKSPLEDIDATNKTSMPVFNSTTGDYQVRVTMTGFKFPKPLMQEHFNENYVESEKYPYCTFKGKVNEKIDWTKDGEHKVTVTGKMELHGVTKEVTADGTMIKKGSEIALKSVFKIKIAEYNIKVPSLYVQNIAEVVDVTMESVLEPFVKK